MKEIGKSWEEIEKIAMKLKWMDISGISVSRLGLLSNNKLGELINEYLGDSKIEDSEIPLAMIATDITTGKKVVLRKGSVAKAVMASTCIPGIFNPTEIDNEMLVDGGIVENVPISTVKTLGAKFVIAVDLNAKHSYKKPENILDLLLNSFHFTMMAAAKLQTEEADLLIQPDLSDFNRSDVSQVPDLIKQGYKDAQKTFSK